MTPSHDPRGRQIRVQGAAPAATGASRASRRPPVRPDRPARPAEGLGLAGAARPTSSSREDVQIGGPGRRPAALSRPPGSALQPLSPARCGRSLEFLPPLAHHIEAGANAFLMPSLYEPCGLNQLYSLAYGTVPIVHATGGLVDTVKRRHALDPPRKRRRPPGFAFRDPTPEAFRQCVPPRPDPLARSAQRGNRPGAVGDERQDWSWDQPARGLYVDRSTARSMARTTRQGPRVESSRANCSISDPRRLAAMDHDLGCRREEPNA